MKLPPLGHITAQLVILGLLYGQLGYWNNPLMGWVLLFAWIVSTGMWWKHVLVSLFGLRRHSVVSDIIGGYVSFSVLGFISSVFLAWYTLTPVIIFVSFLLATCITFLIYAFSARRSFARRESEYIAPSVRFTQTILFSKSRLVIFLFAVVYFIAAYVLYKSREYGGAIFSPWQSIHTLYIILFSILQILMGFLLFSKYKTSSILFFLIALSFLTHAYMPLSHRLPWGGDVWRHMGVEQKIVNGDLELPVLFGSEAKYRDVGLFSLPEALVIPHKYAYGHLWGSTLVVHFLTNLNLLTINKWLVPLLWSLMVPIFLYRIGMKLFHSPRKGLWLAWLSLLVFPLQALGGLTIPVSFGFVFFLFMLCLVIPYIRERHTPQMFVVILFVLCMVFGYTLYVLILIALLGVCLPAVWWIKKIKSVVIQRFSYTIIGLLSIGMIPAIELFGRTSYIPTSISWFFNLKQMIGQFTGLFFAQAIRSHDILSGNIIFNHTPEMAFVASIFVNFRWHILMGMLCILALSVYAFVRIYIVETQKTWLVVGLFSLSIVGGYIAGWYVLAGDRTFIRRLDPVVSLVLLLNFIYTLQHIVRVHARTLWIRAAVVWAIIFVSWFGTTVYASGPDIRVVSMDEYAVAQKVWDSAKEKNKTTCILADTWMLLALEGVSGKQIVGGGFPMDSQFGQKERVTLYEELAKNPTQELINTMYTVSEKEQCMIVLPADQLSDEQIKKIDVLTQSKAIYFGNMYIWESNLKKVE